MELFINGEKRQLVDAQTLTQVLEQTDVAIDRGGIAIAVNDRLIPESQWETVTLHSGDRIEVIHAVQGG